MKGVLQKLEFRELNFYNKKGPEPFDSGPFDEKRFGI